MKMFMLINPEFTNVLKKISENEVPVATVWKILDVLDSVESEIAKYETARVAIVTKHSRKDDEGKVISNNGKADIAPENMEALSADLNALHTLEVAVKTISREDLGSKLTLTPKEAMLLREIVKG